MKNEFFTTKKLPKVKSRRQQMPMPTDFQDYLASHEVNESEDALDNSAENLIVGQDSSVRHLSGKYERYAYQEEHKRIVKDIIHIHADGKVIVRSVEGIQKGVASHCMNSILSIQLNLLNDKETICTQLLMYVGRFEYRDIGCLFAICSTISGHNIPMARYEVLIPTDSFGTLAEHIPLESQAFYKLNYKYPALLKSLQHRQLQTAHRISWQ